MPALEQSGKQPLASTIVDFTYGIVFGANPRIPFEGVSLGSVASVKDF